MLYDNRADWRRTKRMVGDGTRRDNRSNHRHNVCKSWDALFSLLNNVKEKMR